MSKALAAFCFAMLLGAAAAAGEEITVFAAASLTDSLKQIASGYEQTSSRKIIFNFDASSILARQIAQGAPADIFFSADEAKMDALDRNGLLMPGTRRSLLSNSLAIVVALDGGAEVARPQDLASEKVQRLALADPVAVPAGIYAKAYLQKAGLWPGVKNKIIPAQNVRAALAAVGAGNADAAIVYKTDAAISKKVKVVYEIPVSGGPDIIYPVAIIKDTPHPEGARNFLAWLESPNAAEVFQKSGFGVRR